MNWHKREAAFPEGSSDALILDASERVSAFGTLRAIDIGTPQPDLNP
ncbi:MAG TPA: hypothetical protein VM008_09745 [Phycisphaerae bacterium]|nr:hypothetical protein [Phycisphaerae bacterium]